LEEGTVEGDEEEGGIGEEYTLTTRFGGTTSGATKV